MPPRRLATKSPRSRARCAETSRHDGRRGVLRLRAIGSAPRFGADSVGRRHWRSDSHERRSPVRASAVPFEPVSSTRRGVTGIRRRRRFDRPDRAVRELEHRDGGVLDLDLRAAASRSCRTRGAPDRTATAADRRCARPGSSARRRRRAPACRASASRRSSPAADATHAAPTRESACPAARRRRAPSAAATSGFTRS